MSTIGRQEVLQWFEKISSIPRTSGNEKGISDELKRFSKENGFEVYQDEAHNLIIRKKAHPGEEHRKGMVLQGHLDMVGEKDSDSKHDFLKDPIEFVFDKEILRAKGTTLGADNGVALAIAMAVLESEELKHPPLELLFTTEEEVGLLGAKALDEGKLEGNYLLNLDGEEEGVFLTSCAGGNTIDVDFAFGKEEKLDSLYKLELTSLLGGHSGLDIDKDRVNGIKAVANLLLILNKTSPVKLVSFDAPGKFNAINREAKVIFNCNMPGIEEKVQTWFEGIKEKEADAKLFFESIDEKKEAFTHEDSKKILQFIEKVPQGVYSFSKDLEGLVESSLNIGLIEEKDTFRIILSTRSSDPEKQMELIDIMDQLARKYGAKARVYNAYPGWKFDPENALLHQSKKIYRDLFGDEAKVTAVHGGLECGVLKDKYPKMNMLSVGADLKDVHTPRERLDLNSLDKLIEFVCGVLEKVE